MLIPFVKNGKVIPFVWVETEEPEEHYQTLTPDMFDFPCSDSFRGFYHEKYGNGDPGKITQIEKPENQTIYTYKVVNVKTTVKPKQSGGNIEINNREDITDRLY